MARTFVDEGVGGVKNLVILSGGFDPIHMGHVYMLEAASLLVRLLFVSTAMIGWCGKRDSLYVLG